MPRTTRCSMHLRVLRLSTAARLFPDLEWPRHSVLEMMVCATEPARTRIFEHDFQRQPVLSPAEYWRTSADSEDSSSVSCFGFALFAGRIAATSARRGAPRLPPIRKAGDTGEVRASRMPGLRASGEAVIQRKTASNAPPVYQ